MRKPPNEFAEYLRALRKAKGWRADDLSLKVNRSKAYLGCWERGELKTIDREVLLNVAQVLELTETEKRKLFRLADLQHTPNAAKHLYSPDVNPNEVLLEALLECPHDAPFPASPTDYRSVQGAAFSRATGAVLAFLCAKELDLFHPYTSIRWPEAFVGLGIVPAPDDRTGPIDIPEAVLRSEISDPQRLDVLPSLPPEERAKYSIYMARIYYKLLFSDLDRARQVVATLQRWDFTGQSETSVRFYLRFKTSDHQDAFGFDDVDSQVVRWYSQLSLARFLWTAHAADRGGIKQVRQNPWLPPFKLEDCNIVMRGVLGFVYDPTKSNLIPGIRDALYLVQSPAWPALQVPVARTPMDIARNYGLPCDPSVVMKLERQLPVGRLDRSLIEYLKTNLLPLIMVRTDILLAILKSCLLRAGRRPSTSAPSESVEERIQRTAALVADLLHSSQAAKAHQSPVSQAEAQPSAAPKPAAAEKRPKRKKRRQVRKPGKANKPTTKKRTSKKPKRKR